MFDSLSEGLQSAFKSLRGKGKLTEANMREGLQTVERALLEADVSYPVVQSFMEHVTTRALGQRVLFPGFLPGAQAMALYAALDLFVAPRLDLPVTRLVTPLKPVEAMAAGCPVLASDLPPLREQTAGGAAAALVPPGDPEALADAIEALRGDPARRADLAAAGRDVVAQSWSWTRLATAYSDLYARLT